jgi:hypothetical protein
MNGNPKLKWLKNLKYREIEPIVVEILSIFINLSTLLSIQVLNNMNAIHFILGSLIICLSTNKAPYSS